MENVISAQSMLDAIASKSLVTGDGDKDVYRIGDLAKEFNVSLRTLRFYEDRGLISPDRVGSTRLYSQEDRTRLKVIILTKNVGFSLVDIQELLKIYDGSGSAEDVAKIKAKFHTQLENLKVQREEVDRSIGDLNNAISLISDF